MFKEVKLVRLRDITLHHMRGINENVGVDKIDALERDIIVWVKNWVMTNEELTATPSITHVGDNDIDREAIQTR